MWYKIDFDRLVLLLLPTFLRKPVLFGFIKALVSPVASLHYKWEQMRAANLLRLSYNGQRCYLRGVLNDRYDPDLRRIYIDEVPELSGDYIFTPAENLDYYLDTMWLDLDYSYQGELVDFVVFVPAEILNSKKNEIVVTLEFYKLAGKIYKIIAI